MNPKERLFELLYTRSFVYRDNPPFTLASGKTSSYYFDCKATTLHQEGLSLLGEAFLDMLSDTIEQTGAGAVGGLTLGADPIALSTSIAAYTRGMDLRPLIVRKEAKGHGTKKWIEGDLDGLKKVIALDDVITTGGSTIKAIERLREGGLEVVAAAVIIDRQEGGRENIEEIGVPVISLFTRNDFDDERLK